MKLIVDLLGNDHGPKEIVHGLINSLNKTKMNFLLVGPEKVAREVINEREADLSRFEFIDTNEYISNDDDPARSIRSKKDASQVLGMKKLNEEGDGYLTSGSTGALVAGGLFITKRIGSIQRATLLTYIPTVKNTFTILVDSGAVVDTKPSMLNEFALMGSVVAEKYLGKNNPEVYLLNIGAEEGKGDTRTKEAYDLLKVNDKINFKGNIEARDFLSGKADVIVADGFSGNVMLKATEGAAKILFKEIKDVLMSSNKAKIGGALIKSDMKELAGKYDYDKAGAGVLIGVNKPLFKAHGNADRNAIEYAIYKVEEFIKSDIVNTIKERI